MVKNFLLTLIFGLWAIANLSAQVKGNVENSYQQSSWDMIESINSTPTTTNYYQNSVNPSAFQSGWTSPYGDNAMVFQVNSLMNVEADAYLAIFNITQLGETAAEADSLLNLKVSGFLGSLSGLGITSKDVSTDIISLNPIYEFEMAKKFFSRTYTEVPSGFELQKNIHVRYTQSDWLDPILTLAASNEIYDLVKVDYFIGDVEGVYTQLRTRCIDNFNQKIKDFGKLGMKLDTVYHIVSEDRGMVFPLDRYKTCKSYQSTALEKGRGKDEITTLRKPTTYYYDKLPYRFFDIVINPEYLQPVVQVTYKLTVKYIIKDTVKMPEKEFILVTPEGVVRSLKVE